MWKTIGRYLIYFFCWFLFICDSFLIYRLIHNRYKVQNPNSKTLFNQVTPSRSCVHNLFVSGNSVFGEDGKAFIFRGVTSNAFRYTWEKLGFNSIHEILFRFQQVHDWGANTIQLYLDPDRFDTSTEQGLAMKQHLATVLRWGAKNCIQMILNPVNDDAWGVDIFHPAQPKRGVLKSRRMVTFLEELAKEYGTYQHVMFGIEAEPKYIDTPEVIQKRIEAVRQYNHMPLLVPTANFYGKLNIVLAILEKHIKDANIIIDDHPYVGEDIASSSGSGSIITSDSLWSIKVFKNLHPIVFGEFGGFWGGDFNTALDLDIMMQIGLLAKKENISFIAYSIDDPLLAAFDKQGNITPRGVAIRELLRY